MSIDLDNELNKLLQEERFQRALERLKTQGDAYRSARAWGAAALTEAALEFLAVLLSEHELSLKRSGAEELHQTAARMGSYGSAALQAAALTVHTHLVGDIPEHWNIEPLTRERLTRYSKTALQAVLGAMISDLADDLKVP